ncbi:cyclin-dependent kinase inhibitor 3 family protein [Vibrio sp. RC27]
MTHPTWELLVDDSALVLMPCPGTKEADLQSSLEQLKAQGVMAIVTAISCDEMKVKNVEQLGDLSEKLGITWFHLPIEDDCAPDAEFEAKWQDVSPQLESIMTQSGKVALHCMGGSGRTGLLAARLLLDKGWELPDIITQVQALRPGAFQKSIQIEYIEQFA